MKKRRLKDLKSNESQEPPPNLEGKPETEWSRFRCKKAIIEEMAEDLCQGLLHIVADDKAGVGYLSGALISKPDLLIQTTSGDRQQFGRIKKVILTRGKKEDSVHAVAYVTTSPDVEGLTGRAVKIERRQGDLPLDPKPGADPA